jgi:4-amino-4-deoxy-L-arabinose transferase-like glycosyltransferase
VEGSVTRLGLGRRHRRTAIVVREPGAELPSAAAPLAGVSIVLPCFDEAGNVAEAIRAASAAAAECAQDYEVVVVDDGSRDATGDVARAFAAADPRVRVVVHERNRGYGEALRSGLAAARMPWVLLTDADLQFDLGQLAELVPLTREADLVVGRRAPRCDPLVRRLNATLWNGLVRRLFQLPVRDVDCAFKLVRAELVHGIVLRSRGAMVSTELVVRAVAAGARVREVDVRHRPRLAGHQSGASPRVVVRAFRELGGLYGELRALSSARPRGRRHAIGAARLARVAPLAALLALAAVLRLWELDRVGGNAFYDAAVRSMSRSWHNLFFGAYDPTAMTAIDKAPVDLWLQVVSVKLLGFTSVALHLPEALGAIAAVGLLYGAGRRLFGRTAGIAAAAALAVMPVSVLTGRSDTMDSLMGALVVLTAWLIVRGAQAPKHRTRWLVAAGAVLGVAFNVKLAEALVPLPALVLLVWLAWTGDARRRPPALLAAAAAFVAVSLSWLVAVTLAAGPKPFPISSQNGSAWNVVLVFDGLSRLGLAPSANPQLSGAGAGPFALFGIAGAHLGALIGGELLSALLAGGAALALARRRPVPRPTRAGVVFVAAWILTGLVVFSLSAGLRTRYLEALAPAVALALGAALAGLARTGAARPRRTAAAAGAALACTILLVAAFAVPAAHPPAAALIVTCGAALAAATVARVGTRLSARALTRTLVMLGLVGLLAIPATTSLRLVQSHSSDAGNPGGMPLSALARLSDYLATHRHGARYELATAAAAKAGPLIARDGQPVLVLTSAYGIPLVTARQLAADVSAGRVRYLLAGGAPCRPGNRFATGCAPAVRWAHAHGTDVSAAAGAPRRGMLLRLVAPRPRSVRSLTL